MKKLTVVFVFIIVMTLLSSCGLNNISIPPMPTATPVPVITAVPTSTPEPVPETTGFDNPIIINIKDIYEHYMDPKFESYEILSFRCQIPSVHIENNDAAAEKINKTLSDNCKEIFSDSKEEDGVGVTLDKRNELLALAEDNFTEENIIEFKYSRMAKVKRADDNIIVINFSETTKTFGDETTKAEIFCFDTKTGARIDSASASLPEYEEPPKKEQGTLSVSAETPKDKNVLDLIVVDEDGEDYYISCNGVVYDLYIGDTWYCNFMKDNVIQVRTKLPEGLPTLSVSYTSGGEVYILVLAKDLDSGKPVLKNSDQIQAVG